VIVVGGAVALDRLFPAKVIKVNLCLDPVGDPGRCEREGLR
jgi:hypothetical protein